MYRLYCITVDGEYYTLERNIFGENGEFDSVAKAWKRNEDMGSRHFFYPIRLVVESEKPYRIPKGG